jgi:UDP-N-acetylmuramyl pentapeptide phosphotransferase/UDP-N-acetylglucosamine-1-phosphate transferase
MILFFASLASLSFLLTFVIRKIAIQKNIIDTPNERSSHTSPTPRGGGLAIVISWYIGISILFFLDMLNKQLYFALLSGAGLAIISIIDDVISLKPGIRLLIQTLSAISALYLLHGFEIHSIQQENIFVNIVIGFIAVVGIIWFINLFNFLDGIDAYASLEAIFLVLAIYFFVGSPVLLVLCAAILGFLFWNWPKAKIFMGDVGSTQLGFILVVLGIYYHNSHEFAFINWIMLSSLFWFDASYTLFRRWRNKENISQAHKKHAYQRIVQAGYSHLKTDIYAIVINLVILLLVYLSVTFPVFTLPSFFITILLLFFVTKRIDLIFPFTQKK